VNQTLNVVVTGDNAVRTAASIGLGEGGEKHFSRSAGLGLFASAHDSQMTVWRAFRNFRNEKALRGGGGQARENSAASGSRVRDSHLQNNSLMAMRSARGAGTKSPAVVQNAIIAPMEVLNWRPDALLPFFDSRAAMISCRCRGSASGCSCLREIDQRVRRPELSGHLPAWLAEPALRAIWHHTTR
jgi:hypothetical protein